MLDLDEAIKHAEEAASCGGECGAEHKQLAAWLKELREKRVLCERIAEKAATAEKWRSLASGKNGDGRTVQEIQHKGDIRA